MSRDHEHAAFGTERRFALALALNLPFVACEVIYGLRYDSLARLSDAGHNLHVTDPEGGIRDDDLARLARDLRERFGIGHVTVQVERGSHPCERSAERAL